SGPQVIPVAPDEIPQPYCKLLVHHNHMTKVLEAHHGGPVKVEVLQYKLDNDRYSRKIILTNPAREVVELGLVHLDFQYMSAEVRKEIEQREPPLGAILIKHNVLRRIEPHRYLMFGVDWPGAAEYGVRFAEPVYGRLATIYCNNEPAIHLLEIA